MKYAQCDNCGSQEIPKPKEMDHEMTDVIKRMKKFQRDWTRLLPRPKWKQLDKERVAYLVEFLTHGRGSRVAVSKASKELMALNK